MTFLDYVQTDWGIVGLAWNNEGVVSLKLPRFDEHELALLMAAELSEAGYSNLIGRPVSDCEIDAVSSLPCRLQEYFRGQCVDFSDVPVQEHGGPFQRRVRKALRSVGYGNAVSYGELATMAGSPMAARAVGQAMASNRLPIVVPCHRVLSAGGQIGGFSAGLQMKTRLLELEGITQR